MSQFGSNGCSGDGSNGCLGEGENMIVEGTVERKRGRKDVDSGNL